MSRRPRPSRLAWWINAGLFGFAALAVGLTAAVYVGVGTLRERIDVWNWTDDVAMHNSELSRRIELAQLRDKPEADAPVLEAFDRLAATIEAPGMKDGLARSLMAETEAARAAFLEDRRQRDLATGQIRQLDVTATAISKLVADEVSAAKLETRDSDRRSAILEAAQRRRIDRITRIVDAITAAQSVQTQVTSLIDYVGIEQVGSAKIDLTGIPGGCDGETPDPKLLCSPSPVRLRSLVGRLNAMPPGAARSGVARNALWAVAAYLRALRREFEGDSATLASSIDAFEQERVVQSALAARLVGLNRLNKILHDIRGGVDALPQTPPDGIGRLEGRMSAYLFQLRQRGRGLIRSGEGDEDGSQTIRDATSALETAWENAAAAMAARHAGAAAMSEALDRMQTAILEEAERVRKQTGRWIELFTSTALVALIVFAAIVSAAAVLAFRTVARPISRITDLILEMARGTVDRRIDEREGGRSLGDLFRALEILRQSNKARLVAERRASATAAELERAHDRLTRVANTAPAGLYEMQRHPDGSMDFPYVSEKFRQLFGLPPGPCDAGDVFDHVEPEDAEDLRRAIALSAVSLQPLRHRHRVRHPDRGTIWLVNVSTPVRDENGLVQWVGTVADVTEEVGYERALEDARLKAEAANEAKSQFLANMSHEIRTPMNGIIGMCDLLRDTRMTDEQTFCAETIGRSAENLLSIINDVLDLSKIEADKHVVFRESFSVRDLVYEVCHLVSPKAWKARLELCVDFDDTIGRRIGDPGKLRQILLNLLGNAVKFTSSGSITVKAGRGEGDAIRIAVRDTGIGISKEDFDRIFDAFEQVDNARTRCFDGTGLGLAISQRLARVMGGRIDIESELGLGSEFSLTLPLPPDVGAASEVPPDALGDVRVLLVETVGVTQTVVARQVSALGAEVAAVSTPDAALDRIDAALQPAAPDAARIDVAILDWTLPQATLETLRDRLVRTGRAVLLHAPIEVALGNRLSGAPAWEHILIRPSKTQDMLDTIRRAMRRSEERVAPQEAAAANGSLAGCKGLKVLIAEDNRTNQIILRKMLERLSVRPTVHENGEEVLAAYRHGGADVIFMDVSMPVMNGLEATRYIRAHEASTGEPPALIVALTAHASEDDRRSCVAAGMDAFLTKPVKTRQVQEAIASGQARAAARAGAGGACPGTLAAPVASTGRS